MRLNLVTQSWAERQTFLYAEVVLDVRGGLQAPIRDVRIADAANVAARRAGNEVVEALERIDAEIARSIVRAKKSQPQRLILRQRVIKERAQKHVVDRRFSRKQLRLMAGRQRRVEIRRSERVLSRHGDGKRAAILQQRSAERH